MSIKSKAVKLLGFFIIISILLCFASTASANQEFVLYKITYHCNYTPAVPNIEDAKYNVLNFTVKDVGTDPGECNFKHPMMTYIFQGWSTTPDDDT
ncbi:MAG: hypothetical protein ACOX7H_02990 [Bacillota bacterium]|jgi:hypothetical protein